MITWTVRLATALVALAFMIGFSATAQSDNTYISGSDLAGDWLAYGYNCGGPTPVEKISISAQGPKLTAVKMLGDRCVPTGHRTFEGVIFSGEIRGNMYVSPGPGLRPITTTPIQLVAEGPNLITSNRGVVYKRVGATFTTQERDAINALEEEIQSKATIEVEVLYENTREPAVWERVTLTLQGEDIETGSHELNPDDDGKWLFEGLPDGVFDVFVEGDGWLPESKKATVIIEDGGDYKVPLRLTPARVSVEGKLTAYDGRSKPLAVPFAPVSVRFSNGDVVDLFTSAKGQYRASTNRNARSFRVSGAFEDEGGQIQVRSDRGFAGNLVRYSSSEFEITRPMHDNMGVSFLANSESLNQTNSKERLEVIEASATFYAHLMDGVLFARNALQLQMDHALPVENTLFVSEMDSNGDGEKTEYLTVAYNRSVSAIHVTSAKNISHRTDPSSPDNRELHEYGHHVMADSLIGGSNTYAARGSREVNHGGIFNTDSSDSVVEGFAIFFSAMARGDPNYSMGQTINLEYNLQDANLWVYDLNTMKFLQVNGQQVRRRVIWEEFQVAALLWDLYDARNEPGDFFTIPPEEIVSLLGGYRQDGGTPFSSRITDVATIYNRLKSNAIGQQDSDPADGMSDLDRLFVLHRFYSDADKDGALSPNERIGTANFHSEIFPNRIRTHVPENLHSGILLSGDSAHPVPDIAEVGFTDADGTRFDLGLHSVKDQIIRVHVPADIALFEITPLIPGFDVGPIQVTPEEYWDGIASAEETGSLFFTEKTIVATENGVPSPRNFERGIDRDGLIVSWTGQTDSYVVVASTDKPATSPNFGEVIYEGPETWVLHTPVTHTEEYRAYSIFGVDANGKLSRPLVVEIGGLNPSGPSRLFIWLLAILGGLAAIFVINRMRKSSD